MNKRKKCYAFLNLICKIFAQLSPETFVLNKIRNIIVHKFRFHYPFNIFLSLFVSAINGKIFPFLFEVERLKNKASVVGRMFIFCENTAEPKKKL